jgi:hypothetical protein
MAMVHLIYCADGGTKYSPIAVEEGFLYGCRSDGKPTQKVSFADINWKKPNLERHLDFVREHCPLLAVAPDIEDRNKITETIRYAEQLARYAQYVIIVPKDYEVIEFLPHEPWLVLGYSVPTKYAGLDMLGTWDFLNRPVHLLGGSPMAQLHLAHYLRVFSADGNSAQGAARHGVFFSARTGEWVSRSPEIPLGDDLPYRAFRRSCQEIKKAWERIS